MGGEVDRSPEWCIDKAAFPRVGRSTDLRLAEQGGLEPGEVEREDSQKEEEVEEEGLPRPQEIIDPQEEDSPEDVITLAADVLHETFFFRGFL